MIIMIITRIKKKQNSTVTVMLVLKQYWQVQFLGQVKN